MNRISRIPTALLLLACATTGFAEEPPDGAQAKAAILVFERAFSSPETPARAAAVAELVDHDDSIVVAAVGTKGLADPAPEVRDVAAQVLGRMTGHREEAGAFLRDHLAKNEGHHEVQISIIRAIARLGYTAARAELIGAARHFKEEEYRFVTNEVLRAFAKLKDGKALPFLLYLAEYEGKTLRGKSGPRVKAGSREQARRIWWKKYGKDVMPKGEAEQITRWWMQELVAAVTVITGEEFEDDKAFRAWVEKHRKELGLTTKETRKRKPGEAWR